MTNNILIGDRMGPCRAPFDFFMPEKTVILNASAVNRALTRIAHEIAERNDNSQAVVIVGVQRGGVHLAERLGCLLTSIWGHDVPVGSSTSACTATTSDQQSRPTSIPPSSPSM